MTTTHLVMDLETIPAPEVPFEDKPKSNGFVVQKGAGSDLTMMEIELHDANPFAPPPCHQIAVIGYAVFEDYLPITMKCVGQEEDSEQRLLELFLPYLEQLKPCLVTWN